MKKTLSIIVGVITGILIVYLGDAITHAIYPPPVGLNYLDKNVMVAYVASIPRYILLLMTFFWLLSSLLGGLVVAKINKSEWRSSAVITGSILMVAAILNLVMITHPLWMWVCTVVGYIPMAYLGAWMGQKRKPDEK